MDQSLQDYIAWFTTPVTNRGQLISKFHHRLVEDGFNRDEDRWTEMVCAAFSHPAEFDKSQPWTMDDLGTYLGAIVPPRARPMIPDAVPILYRLFLRLGSRPYHLTPENVLTSQMVRSAIAQLTRRTDFVIRYWGGELPIEEYNAIMDAKFTRILFQCLAADNTSAESTLPSEGTRTEDDDTDLIEALEVLEPYRFVTDPVYVGAIIARRPSLPDRMALPSSRSADLDGKVSVKEWRILLTLLQAVCKPNGTGDIPADQPDPTGLSDKDLDWKEFQVVMKRSPLMDNFDPLLGSLVRPPIRLEDLTLRGPQDILNAVRTAYDHN